MRTNTTLFLTLWSSWALCGLVGGYQHVASTFPHSTHEWSFSKMLVTVYHDTYYHKTEMKAKIKATVEITTKYHTVEKVLCLYI